MLGSDDSIRISQTALNRAGTLHLRKSLRQGEKMAALLKFMVEKSAIASGRKRSKTQTRLNRRRYGDFILMLKGNVLVDITAIRHWCPHCLGAHRSSTEHHCCN